MKQFLIVFASLFGLAFLVSFVLPSQWEVSREMQINADPTDVHFVTSDLETWQRWSPWSLSVDPKASITASPNSHSVGSRLDWDGPDLGRGNLTVSASERGVGVWFDLGLRGGREKIKGVLQFSQPPNGGCLMKFTLRGDVSNDPVGRYVALMRAYTVGPDLNDAMLRLKRQIERGG